MARFLIEDVAPVYREAKITLMRINPMAAPLRPGLHPRMPQARDRAPPPAPRSPDLNAFIERFQGTCLHLHYRTAFRYRYYTSATDIDGDLQAWLRHCNFERPRHGYRTAGRRPAELFYAHRPGLRKMNGWDPNELLKARAA